MQVIKKGIAKDNFKIQVEEWNENYNFIPHSSTLAIYKLSKSSHKGQFAPKGGEIYRFQFDFKTEEEANAAFNDLVSGNKNITEFISNLNDPSYKDCI